MFRGDIVEALEEDRELVSLAPAPEVQIVQLRVPLSYGCLRARGVKYDLARIDISCIQCKALH